MGLTESNDDFSPFVALATSATAPYNSRLTTSHKPWLSFTIFYDPAFAFSLVLTLLPLISHTLALISHHPGVSQVAIAALELMQAMVTVWAGVFSEKPAPSMASRAMLLVFTS